MKKILIATDGSAPAKEAVELGLDLAAEQGADVAFVHVVPPDKWTGGRGGMRPIPHEAPIDESESALKEAAEAADEAGVSYSLERISGETVDEIIAVADGQDADLIVVGSRGRGAVSSAFLGSVSSDLVKRAKRPVLVVKTAPARVTA